jgi:hypothetical protein
MAMEASHSEQEIMVAVGIEPEEELKQLEAGETMAEVEVEQLPKH